MTLTSLSKAPFPWFGGKRQAAPTVWALLGDVDHYVEPFAGTLAVLLERPHPANRSYHSETVNDADGLIANVWRAIRQYPQEVAEAASWPVCEVDKQARQIAVLKWRDERVIDLLAGSAEWCDPKMAGWWLYGVCCQIGAIGGPWTADPVTGRITKQPGSRGVSRDLPHISDDGRGVNHAGLREPGVSRDLPHISGNGQGVNRPQLREPGVGDDTGDDDEDFGFHPWTMPELRRWMAWLSARLRHVRILSGDWSRAVTTGAAKTIPVRQGGAAGIFLDPPYDHKERDGNLYDHDATDLAAQVRAWCHRNGGDRDYRIVLAGYDTEHTSLEADGWTVHEWYKQGYLTGGMGNVDGTSQQHRERLWASPHCLTPTTVVHPEQGELWSSDWETG